MKHFFRSFPGKCLVFILCILFSCVFLASVICMAFLLGENMYDKTPEQMIASYTSSSAERIADDITFGELYTATPYWDKNVSYLLTDLSGETVIASSKQYDLSNLPYEAYYQVYRDEDGYAVSISYMIDRNFIAHADPNAEYYHLRFSAPQNFESGFIRGFISLIYAVQYSVYAIAFFSFLAALGAFILLMRICGRRPGTEELHPSPLHRIPYDVMLFAGITGIIAVIAIFVEINDSAYTQYALLLITGVITALFCMCAALLLLMDLACRAKLKTLWNTMLCWRICAFFWRGCITLLKSIPLVPKTAALLAGAGIFEFLLLMAMRPRHGEWILLWLVEKAVFTAAILYAVLLLRRLQKTAKALAAGNLSQTADDSHMPAEFAAAAHDLNSISLGISRAVEERVKSERMKTELITNVSHDIKTPLTSIINYAGLIADEPTENGTIKEYSEVLVRQSQRLKRLLEDLVEASKASTGNLDVLLAPCSPSTFILQAGGEYEEKLQAAGLSLVTRVPEKEAAILADGRRMWRIFDNLMNNICKYALPGSRVYLTLETTADEARISFKNTSREQLNISEAELMERFVRGDSSRSTEGSGLGLSIARSLTELQGGSLELTIDGDLFKVELKFPLVVVC